MEKSQKAYKIKLLKKDLARLEGKLDTQTVSGFVSWCIKNCDDILPLQTLEAYSLGESEKVKNYSKEELAETERIFQAWLRENEKLLVSEKESEQIFINILSKLIKNGLTQPPKNIALAFKQLLKYCVLFHTYEEKEMGDNNYNQLSMHSSQHRNFLRKIKQQWLDFQKGNQYILIELIPDLQRWYLLHILKIDHQYTNFLNNSKGN